MANNWKCRREIITENAHQELKTLISELVIYLATLIFAILVICIEKLLK